MDVVIDGVKYRQGTLEETGLDDEARRLLREVSGILWSEAYYDPYNEYMRDFARPLSDKMTRLNEILGFKK